MITLPDEIDLCKLQLIIENNKHVFYLYYCDPDDDAFFIFDEDQLMCMIIDYLRQNRYLCIKFSKIWALDKWIFLGTG